MDNSIWRGYNATPASRAKVASRRNARSISGLLPLHSVPQSPAWTACLLAFERELTPQQFATWIRPLSCADESGTAATDRPQPVRTPVGEGSLWRPYRDAGPPGHRRSDGGRVCRRGCRGGDGLEGARSCGDRPGNRTHGRVQPADTRVDHPGACGHVDAVRTAPRGTGEPQSDVHVRIVRRRQSQPARPSRGHAGGRAPDVVQPAVRLRRRGPRQDAPDPGDRQLRSCCTNPGAKIRYIHAETYVSDVVRAYQHKAFDDFKRYYRTLDLLLIDDIQFFGGKSRTQEEFFYLFNTLIEAHKQVVITCDTYPKEISGIEERLISRFGWGLTVASSRRSSRCALRSCCRRPRRWGCVSTSRSRFSSPSTFAATSASWRAR